MIPARTKGHTNYILFCVSNYSYLVVLLALFPEICNLTNFKQVIESENTNLRENTS